MGSVIRLNDEALIECQSLLVRLFNTGQLHKRGSDELISHFNDSFNFLFVSRVTAVINYSKSKYHYVGNIQSGH